jgi:hypothetical protein
MIFLAGLLRRGIPNVTLPGSAPSGGTVSAYLEPSKMSISTKIACKKCHFHTFLLAKSVYFDIFNFQKVSILYILAFKKCHFDTFLLAKSVYFNIFCLQKVSVLYENAC